MHRLRRLRALLGLAIAWGIIWIPLGLAVVVIDTVARGRSVRLGSLLGSILPLAAIGAFSGFAFGLILAAAERNRSFGALSTIRLVVWGTAGALAIPVTAAMANIGWTPISDMMSTLIAFGTLGAISSAATLAVARRAPPELGNPNPAVPLNP
jgi:hypothetical protein